MKQMSRKSQEPVWQLGYRCHTLWSGPECLGRIDLSERCDTGTGPEYLCSAGTHRTTKSSLREAKRWVARSAGFAKVQMSLF